MSDIFREVDEDVRRQEVEQMVRRYGPIVVGVVALVLIVFGGYSWWQNQREAELAAAGDRMIAALEQVGEGETDAALAEFTAMAEDAPGGYRMLAQFQQAAVLRQQGDNASALAIYDEMAADGAYDQLYRDLARLYAGYAAMSVDETTLSDLQDRLGPVAEGSGPWRYHANEVLGFAALQAGERELAVAYLSQITDAASAPAAVSSRADELMNIAQAGTGASSVE